VNGSGKVVTLIIHGTFAEGEKWWRLGAEGEDTFADKLEAALARRGLAWTVWRPALGKGLGYEDFSWTGRNRHGDRMKAAKKLRRGLAALAEKVGATRGDPITVNLVAHSNGGNVVLETLRSLPPGVRVGRVAMLGTPLLAMRPSLRILRLFIAMLLLLTVLVLWIDVGLWLVDLLTPGSLVRAEGLPEWGYGPRLLLVAAGATALYGALTSALTMIGDTIWRAVLYPFQAAWAAWVLIGGFAAEMVAAVVYPSLYRPDLFGAALLLLFSVPVIARSSWRWSQRVYGPATAALERALRDEPAVLFTSHYDEAALLLQFSNAPERLYVAEVRHRLRQAGGPLAWLLRIVEYVAIRSAVVGLLLKAVEVVFERLALGFGLFRLLFFEYGLADLEKGSAYPADSIVRRVDVTEELKPTVAVMPDPLGLDPRRGVDELRELAPHVGDRHAATLRETLVEVIEYLKAQIRFRHSLYYESPAVVERVAALFTADST